MVLKILQDNFIPFVLCHTNILGFLVHNCTSLRVLWLWFSLRLDRCVTFDWLVICICFPLWLFGSASCRANSVTDLFIKGSKLTFTYIGHLQNQVVNFLLNQIIELFLRGWVDGVLIAEFVYQKIGKLFTFCLLFVVLVLRVGAGLLGIHLWMNKRYSYLNRSS